MVVSDSANHCQQQTEVVTIEKKTNSVHPVPGRREVVSVGEILQLYGTASYPNGTIMNGSHLEWSARRHQQALDVGPKK
jgi:hypothetical protein